MLNVAKGNANRMAHLVGQGQKEVIEEDGGDCNCIILTTILRSQSQNRLKSTPTFPPALKVSKSKGRLSGIMDWIKGRAAHLIPDVNNLLQSRG